MQILQELFWYYLKSRGIGFYLLAAAAAAGGATTFLRLLRLLCEANRVRALLQGVAADLAHTTDNIRTTLERLAEKFKERGHLY